MGRWERCGELRETGNANADGFIFSFLKGAQAKECAPEGKGAASLGSISISWACGRGSPNPPASHRPGVRGFRDHSRDHFLFLLKDLEEENILKIEMIFTFRTNPQKGRYSSHQEDAGDACRLRLRRELSSESCTPALQGVAWLSRRSPPPS